TQALEVHDEAGLRVDGALDCHVELVVVAMPVGIRAQPERLRVARRAPVVATEPMCRAEVHAPRDPHDRHAASVRGRRWRPAPNLRLTRCRAARRPSLQRHLESLRSDPSGARKLSGPTRSRNPATPGSAGHNKKTPAGPRGPANRPVNDAPKDSCWSPVAMDW